MVYLWLVSSWLSVHCSRNNCVRLELHVVCLTLVEGVAEWTERLRGLAKIRVRLPAQAGRFWFPKRVVVDAIVYFYIFLLFVYANAADCLQDVLGNSSIAHEYDILRIHVYN